jgi:hypothetical protein
MNTSTITLQGTIAEGSMVIDFQSLTKGGLSSLRYLCETEATKNPDPRIADYYHQAARAIHTLQEEVR